MQGSAGVGLVGGACAACLHYTLYIHQVRAWLAGRRRRLPLEVLSYTYHFGTRRVGGGAPAALAAPVRIVTINTIIIPNSLLVGFKQT